MHRQRLIVSPPRFAAILLLGASVAACGARPGMEPGAWDAAATTDAHAPPGDAALPGVDAALPLPPCTWVAGDTHAVTSPPNDKDVHSAVVTAHGVLVAWMVSNPDPPSDTTRRLQRLTWLGEPDGPAEALFPPPGQMSSYSGVSLAPGPEHFGATVWDDAGQCRFRSIDAAGAVLDAWRTVEDGHCGSLRSTPEGFSLLTWRPGVEGEHRLVRLAADGARVSRSAPIPALQGEVNWWASLALPDGDLLVAGLHSGFDALEIQTQRLDPEGVPRAAPQVLALLDAPARRVRLVATREGVLAGWSEERPSAASAQFHQLVLQPLDVHGTPVGPPRWHGAAPVVYRDAGWSLTAHDDGVLAAWVEPAAEDPYGDDTTLVVQPVTPQGDLAAPFIPLSQGRFLRDPMLRRTPLGAIALFTAFPEEQAHQVYAAPLRCQREP